MLTIDDSSCWEWGHARLAAGYGIADIGGKTRTVHRFVFEFFSGEKLGRHDLVCHRCNNPPCFNPSHLYKGTGKSNAADRMAAGTQRNGSSRPDVRDKIRLAHLGQKRSTEARAAMSRARLGREPWNKGTVGTGVMKPNSGSFSPGKDAPNKGRKRVVDENGHIRYVKQ